MTTIFAKLFSRRDIQIKCSTKGNKQRIDLKPEKSVETSTKYWLSIQYKYISM